ncbi:MAG: galactokinase family protein [Dermatophilaceae bacterium]
MFGSEPAGVWSVPGQVNLIGEHTDDNGSLVLPIAAARSRWCRRQPSSGRAPSSGRHSPRTGFGSRRVSRSPPGGWSRLVMAIGRTSSGMARMVDTRRSLPARGRHSPRLIPPRRGVASCCALHHLTTTFRGATIAVITTHATSPWPDDAGRGAADQAPTTSGRDSTR